MNRIEIKHVGLIFITSVLLMLPAYLLGVMGYDAETHGLWTKNFYKLLLEGHLYPRFAHEMYAGFGNYVFFFYPPISFYLNSIFMYFGDDTNYNYTAISLSANLAVFLSGISCYVFLESKFNKRDVCFLSLFYMAMPIHIAHDFYISCAMAQFWSYVWFPLILKSMELTILEKKYGIASLSVTTALLTATNIPMLAFMPFALAYGLVMLPSIVMAIRIGMSMAISFLLSAIYTLPTLAYKKYVNIDLHWSMSEFKYYNKFADVITIKSYWNLSVILNVFVTIIMLMPVVIRKDKIRQIIFPLAFVIICIFLCFSISDFIWRIFPIIQIVQFPSRFLSIAPIFLVLIVGFVSKGEYAESTMRLVKIMVLFSIIFSFITAYKASGSYNDREDIREIYRYGIDMIPAYIPDSELVSSFYWHKEDLEGFKKISFIEGNGEVKVLKWDSRDIKFLISAKKGSSILIRQFYFPGWIARVGDTILDVNSDKTSKLIKITLPQNIENQEVSVRLESLPYERYGAVLSLLGAIFVIVIIYRDFKCRVIKSL